MDDILKPFFAEYEKIVDTVEQIFDKVKNEHPEGVVCDVKCADCCHALFDLSLIEAIYINTMFNEKYKEEKKDNLIEIASKTDRKIYKIKRDAYKKFQENNDEDAAIGHISNERVRCPLLNENDLCDMYEHRPITCRLYGIPTAIGGQAHTCGLSGFKEGESYPTVHLDPIHKALYNISEAFVKAIKSRHVRMAEMMVPLSMALITEYNKGYLGMENGQTAEKDKNE